MTLSICGNAFPVSKSEYLAKEYLKEKKILDEEEVKKIGKGLEELNNILNAQNKDLKDNAKETLANKELHVQLENNLSLS